jgi:hypothetical protein
MLGPERLHDRFVEFVATLRITDPANPFWELTVIVERPAALTVTATTVGLDEIVKSGGALTL